MTIFWLFELDFSCHFHILSCLFFFFLFLFLFFCKETFIECFFWMFLCWNLNPPFFVSFVLNFRGCFLYQNLFGTFFVFVCVCFDSRRFLTVNTCVFYCEISAFLSQFYFFCARLSFSLLLFIVMSSFGNRLSWCRLLNFVFSFFFARTKKSFFCVFFFALTFYIRRSTVLCERKRGSGRGKKKRNGR